MSLDVSALTITPNSFKKGQRTATISYTGLVDNVSDNPVTLDFMVEPAAPVFIIASNGSSVKSVRWRETFGTTHGTFTKTITIKVTTTPGSPQSCSLRLEAKDSKGNRSATNSFLIFS
jgi:hypothetical protein